MCLKKLAFDRMNFEAKPNQIGFDRQSGFCKKGVMIAEHSKVIDVAEILIGFEMFFDKVIKPVEINIGKKLAG